MATRTWAGRAKPVAQVSTVQVTAYDAATTYKLTVNGKTVSCIAAGSVNATASALQAAWAAATDTEFKEATATVSTDTVTLTGATSGKTFTATSSVSGGTGTIGSVTNTTTATGPNKWSDAVNWAEGSVPVTGDAVTINQGPAILDGLDQSGVTLASLTITDGFSSQFTIGLPSNTNPAAPSSGYPEYRTQRLKIGATAGDINSTSPRIRLDLSPATTALIVRNTGQPQVATEDALDLVVDDAGGSSTVQILKGNVGLANQPGDSCTVSAVNVSYQTSQASDVNLKIGSGCTITALDQSGGIIVAKKAPTTIVRTAGTMTCSAGAITTLTNRGGTFYHDGTGTITTLNQLAVFIRRGWQAATITNCNIYGGSQTDDRNGTITWTNPPDLVQCRLPAAPNDNGPDVAFVNFGTGRHLAVS